MSALKGMEAGPVPTLAWVAAAWVHVYPHPQPAPRDPVFLLGTALQSHPGAQGWSAVGHEGL